MDIKVRNFRGAERVDIEVSGIALLAGLNGAAKSSVALAVGAALTGRVVPIEGLRKADAGALVRTGEAQGLVEIATGAGQVRVAWPKGDVTTEGLPPAASEFAAGLASLADLDDKQRAKALNPYLNAMPSPEDLAAALRDVGVTDKGIEAVQKAVADMGWDQAHAKAKETGAKLKGAWEQVTGENYGSAKARSWLPQGWTDDLAGASLEALDGEVTDAKRRLEEAIANAAVNQATLERMRAEAADLEPARLDHSNNAERIERLKNELRVLENHRQQLPPAERNDGLPCPHCGGKVRLIQAKQGVWSIEKVPDERLSDADLKKRRLDIATAEGEIGRVKGDLAKAEQDQVNNNRRISVAQHAADALEQAAGRAGGTEAVDEARESLRLAEARRAAFVAKTEADRKAASIAINQAAVAILAPDGLRQTVLARRVEAFSRDHLAPLCAAAGWKAVAIEPDLGLSYGGRPYGLLSDSEQLRVRYTVQVALAKIDGAALVVLDRADTLDQQGRNGLVKLLRHAGVPALVCMTINGASLVPDLERAGLGRSYWIEGGIAVPLAQAQARKEKAA